MSTFHFARPVQPDGEALVRCILRQGTPERVHHIELGLDPEVQKAICERFPHILQGLDAADPAYLHKAQIALQRFLGYDYLVAGVGGYVMPLNRVKTEDTAAWRERVAATSWTSIAGRSPPGRSSSPIPGPTRSNGHHRAGVVRAEPARRYVHHRRAGQPLRRVPDLADGLRDALLRPLRPARPGAGDLRQDRRDLNRELVTRLLQFNRVKIVWGSDDMGFRTGTLISPEDMREFVLPGHKHSGSDGARGGPALSPALLRQPVQIMDDLIDDVQDRRQALVRGHDRERDRGQEDASGSRSPCWAASTWISSAGRRKRRSAARVRETLDACLPGGGYCLGTGNSVANYIPLDNYLAMLDEGRRYTA